MKRVHLYIAVLLLFISFGGKAQFSFSGSINSSATIQSVMAVSITNNSSTSLTLSNLSYYSDGYKVSGLNTVNVKSNVPWNLSVASTTGYFSNSGTYSSATMPSTIVGLSKSGQSSYISLTTTDQPLASGNRGNTSVSGNSFNLDLSVTPGFNYGPGIYNLTMTYTLTAQ